MTESETANFIRNVPVCHACPYRTGGECGADEKHEQIGAKAIAHACPLGKFPARGAGDLLASALDTLRIGTAASKFIEKLTGKPCGCKERQEAMNKAIPFNRD